MYTWLQGLSFVLLLWVRTLSFSGLRIHRFANGDAHFMNFLVFAGVCYTSALSSLARLWNASTMWDSIFIWLGIFETSFEMLSVVATSWFSFYITEIGTVLSQRATMPHGFVNEWDPHQRNCKHTSEKRLKDVTMLPLNIKLGELLTTKKLMARVVKPLLQLFCLDHTHQGQLQQPEW